MYGDILVVGGTSGHTELCTFLGDQITCSTQEMNLKLNVQNLIFEDVLFSLWKRSRIWEGLIIISMPRCFM